MAPKLTEQADLRTYGRIFWRWKWLFLAFVILIPLGVYLVDRGKPKVYASSTVMELQDVSSSLGSAGAPVLSGNIDAVAQLATTTPVAQIAARLLHQPASSAGALDSEVSTSGDADTGFVTITAKDHDPARAAGIANAFAAALSERQSAQARAILNQQIRAVKKQLAGVPPSDPNQRTTLVEQIAQLKGLQASTPAGAQVIQAAVPSSAPVGPSTRRSVEIALAIALLLGIGAVLIADHADRRIRSPDDVERITGWPLLAAIPPSAFSSAASPDPREREPFEMLSGSLVYFNAEQPLRSVAVVSPLIGDGKTTVAVGLALAAAHEGKTVALVDADLRRPQVGARLGLEQRDGLGAVLAGQRSLDEVLSEYPLDHSGAGTLFVLPAGPPPPNPAALLRSERMAETVEVLEERADLVVVDTVAALAGSDPLPVLQLVSGCVAIVRMNRSATSAVRRLQKVIASAKATVFGAAITGASGAAAAYGAGYYYYSQNGRGHGWASRRQGLLRRRRPPTPALNGAAPAGEREPASKQAGGE